MLSYKETPYVYKVYIYIFFNNLLFYKKIILSFLFEFIVFQI